MLLEKNVPYVINSKYAALWYKQESDIPGNLKKAADNAKVYKAIGKYFDEKVLDNFLSGVKVDDMMSELLTLIKESDLSETQKNDLNKLYDEGDLGGFLGTAFLYAILQDNQKTDGSCDKEDTSQKVATTDINREIEAFKQVVGRLKKQFR